MKAKTTFVIFILFVSFSQIFPQGILPLIKIDTLKQYLQEISGYTPVTVDGNTYTISSRNTITQSSNYLAAKYIKYRFQSYGLTVTEQPFTFTILSNTYQAKNVYAVQTGSQYPDKKLIICAHFDAVSVSPGADDNGSGTCAVLEAARVISKLSPKYTVVYALWSGEEQGLYGSKYYAAQAYSASEDIVGVINMDMIGWDSNSNNRVEIYYFNPTGKETLMSALLTKLTDVNANYSLGLTVSKSSSASKNSDHYYFLAYGYPAFLMIEEMNDFNPYYHTSEDKYSYIDLDYYEKCAKLGILTLAELSEAADITTSAEESNKIPTEFVLSQNYPNPFNPSTQIKYTLPAAGYVELKIYDAIGREVKTLVDEYQPAGVHLASFSVKEKNFPSGVYYYTLRSGALNQAKKMIYMK